MGSKINHMSADRTVCEGLQPFSPLWGEIMFWSQADLGWIPDSPIFQLCDLGSMV